MDEHNKARFAQLRELLDQPRRDVRAIVALLREWSDEDDDKDVAAQYAYTHLHEGEPGLPDTYFTTYEDHKMLFDPDSHMLFTNDGTLIKKMECPLTKRWSELEQLDASDFKRFCHDCSKHVVNTKDLTDEQVLAIVRYDPEVCLHIDTAHGNVTPLPSQDDPEVEERILESHLQKHGFVPGIRVIRTARTPNEINRAAREGYRPLVKAATTSDRIKSFMQVWQNNRTGEISVQTDFRYPSFGWESNDEWEVVLPDFRYDPTVHFPSPVAAYLVPADIEAGERVLLEDVIENLIAGRHQGSYRLQRAMAIWDGADFQLQYDEEEDAYFAIG